MLYAPLQIGSGSFVCVEVGVNCSAGTSSGFTELTTVCWYVEGCWKFGLARSNSRCANIWI
jgi:hypothetical protein